MEQTYIVHSREALVFRDGRPFGDEAQLHGGLLRWPQPGTVLGMFRTGIGFARSADYFTGSNRRRNIEEIKKTGLKCMIPLWQQEGEENWQPLFPAPADVIITPQSAGDGENFTLNPLHYSAPGAGEGVNLPWSEWLLPLSEVREKPVKDAPALWFAEQFMAWLEQGAEKQCSREALGVPWPQEEYRLHTAIDNETGTVLEGQLFSSRGIRLEAKKREGEQGGQTGRYGIGVELTGTLADDDPQGSFFLGGDRKIAHIDSAPSLFPPRPAWTEDSARYLRLVLVTPGNFGGWAPDWLLPEEGEENAWKTLPDTTIQLRLVSAVVPRWQPVSGWDMEKRGPKATSRLVPAGSVYVVELKEPETAPHLAEKLWGNNLAMTGEADGYGCVCLGKQQIAHP